MPAVQTVYPGTLAAGIAGQIYDMETHNVITRINGATGTVGFGTVALRGVADDAMLRVGDTNAGAFLGITVLDPTVRPVISSLPDVYQPGDNVAILTFGVVWVVAFVSVTPGQQAYYDTSADITNVSSANTIIPNAFFDSTASAGGLVRLRLNP